MWCSRCSGRVVRASLFPGRGSSSRVGLQESLRLDRPISCDEGEKFLCGGQLAGAPPPGGGRVAGGHYPTSLTKLVGPEVRGTSDHLGQRRLFADASSTSTSLHFPRQQQSKAQNCCQPAWISRLTSVYTP